MKVSQEIFSFGGFTIAILMTFTMECEPMVRPPGKTNKIKHLCEGKASGEP